MNDNDLAIGHKPLEKGINLQEAAAILDYNIATVRRMLKKGDLEGYGSGKKIRVYPSSIERYRFRTSTKQAAPAAQNILRVTGRRHRKAMEEINELLN